MGLYTVKLVLPISVFSQIFKVFVAENGNLSDVFVVLEKSLLKVLIRAKGYSACLKILSMELTFR